MSEKALIARGAECVTGDLVLRNKVVGRYRDGNFYITPEGTAELEVEEVEAREVKPKAPKAPKAAKAAKAAKEADAAEDAAADPAADLDTLLGAAD